MANFSTLLEKYSWPLVIFISAFLCFFNLGKTELASWDESLYGINAIEMDIHKDWFNPYYEGEPDQWNVKPPLFVNLVRLSYQFFGHNTFALRFPSALSAFFLSLLAFRWFKKEWGTKDGLLTVSMIWGCTALIGQHAGRSGDTDALFSLVICGSAFSAYQYSRNLRASSLIITAAILGIGFWVKSTAVLLVFPGLFLFLMATRKLHLKNLLLPAIVFLLFPIAWVAAYSVWGIRFEDSTYGGESGWANSFIYDTFHRFTGSGQFQAIPKKHDFILTFLDSRFNLWHIPFLITAVFIVISLVRKRREFLAHLLIDPLVLLALCITVPYLIVLQISANVNGWYLIPLLPFLAVITTFGFRRLENHWPITSWLWIATACFTTVRHMVEHIQIEDNTPKIVDVMNSREEPELLVDLGLPPNLTLYAHWSGKDIRFVKLDEETLQSNPNQLLIARRAAGIEATEVILDGEVMLAKL